MYTRLVLPVAVKASPVPSLRYVCVRRVVCVFKPRVTPRAHRQHAHVPAHDGRRRREVELHCHKRLGLGWVVSIRDEAEADVALLESDQGFGDAAYILLCCRDVRTHRNCVR